MKLYDSFKDKIVFFISELNKEKIAEFFLLEMINYLEDIKLLDFFPNLHFELCFYQPIEYCIQNNISYLMLASGAHKVLKGMSPNFSYSAHYIVIKTSESRFVYFVKRDRKQHTLDGKSIKT